MTKPQSIRARSRHDSRAARDLAWLVVGATVICSAAVHFQVFANVDISSAVNQWNLDGLLSLVIAVPIVAIVFSARRWNDAAKVEREMAVAALHDSLTGLPNRVLLRDRLEHALARSRRSRRQVAVLYLDVDRFKTVNDTLGHEIGDLLLVALTERLKTSVRPGDTVARLGGDEFAVVCEEIASRADAEGIAARIVAGFEEPLVLRREEIAVTLSIGIAILDDRTHDAEALLRDADFAMYRAKSQGRGRIVLYDSAMRGGVVRGIGLEKALQRAVAEQQFRLLYQPIVSIVDERIVGVEALLRWEDPERGTIPPDEFIPTLEDSGLIVPVGAWVLEEACRQARRWHDEHPTSPLRVTANVSARQLAEPAFRNDVLRALDVSGVSAKQLCLEITEGALMSDVTSAWSMLREIKLLGVSLALDDFGTGYSSLSYVRRFACDMLKIDRSFVDGLESNPEDRAIVAAIISMARALGLTSVAEGVETTGQLGVLRSLGCNLAQGYLFSRPQPAEVIDTLLAAPAFAGGEDAAPATLADALETLWDEAPPLPEAFGRL